MTRTILITGATAGFGRAAVERFAAAGWKVVAFRPRVRDLAGNTRADTVTISVGGPRVAILEPVSTPQPRAVAQHR